MDTTVRKEIESAVRRGVEAGFAELSLGEIEELVMEPFRSHSET